MNKIQEMLRGCSMERLLSVWEHLDQKSIDMEVATVRGCVMDELERRSPEEFEIWILDETGTPISDFFKLQGRRHL